MGIFRRQPRGRHAAAEAAGSELSAEAGSDVSVDSGVPADSALPADFAAGSAPSVVELPPEAALRPSGLTPDAVVATFAADAQRFVATFPYAASPVPEGGLDFTRASLVHIEALLGALHLAGRPLPERLHQSVAVYLFETARREFGGRYLRFEAPDPIILLMGEPRAHVGMCAMSRVAGRVERGPVDSIIHFYASIAPRHAEGAEVTLR